MELDADAVAVGACILAVSQAPDVVHSQDSEDVVQADTCFHIRLVAHGQAGHVVRKQEDVITFGWIVLVAEAAPQPSEGNHLAQTQALDKRQAVHQDAIAPIGEVPREGLVVDELHGLHQGITLRLDGIR